jgi:hypothetical protein
MPNNISSTDAHLPPRSCLEDSEIANLLEIYRLLEKRIHDAGTQPEKLACLLFDDVQEPGSLSQSPSPAAFLREQLGVSYGAFGVADPEKKKFILLQGSQNLADTSLPVISFSLGIRPSLRAEEFQSIIDAMFLTLRKNQPLDTTPPEFYREIYSDPLSGVVRPSNLESLLRKRSAFKVLYCHAGEVGFFLYAWRWLMRHCQAKGGMAPVASEECLRSNPQPTTALWALELWRPDQDSYEWKWLEAANGRACERRGNRFAMNTTRFRSKGKPSSCKSGQSSG